MRINVQMLLLQAVTAPAQSSHWRLMFQSFPQALRELSVPVLVFDKLNLRVCMKYTLCHLIGKTPERYFALLEIQAWG